MVTKSPQRVTTTGNHTTIVMGKDANYVSKVQRQHRFTHELVSAARYLASQAKEAGKDNNRGLRSNVISAVCISYAALEAALNEFVYLNALSAESPLTEEQREVVYAIGREQLAAEPRQNTLQRFNLMLRVIEKPEISIGSDPYQSANLVRVLRNMLTHPIPSSVVTYDIADPDLSTQQDIVKRLRSPLNLDKNATFPDSVLTVQCAIWASRSIERFLSEFERLSGVKLDFIPQVD